MQLVWCLLSNFSLKMFRASLCPSSGEQDRVLLCIVFCTGCAGCGCVELGRQLCAQSNSNFHTVHTARDPAPHNQSAQPVQTPYAVVHGLFLLKMGIMMPETSWERSLIINIRLVASCWFLSLHHKNWPLHIPFRPVPISVVYWRSNMWTKRVETQKVS